MPTSLFQQQVTPAENTYEPVHSADDTASSPDAPDADGVREPESDSSGQKGIRLTGQRIFYTFCLMMVLMPVAFVSGILYGRYDAEQEHALQSPMARIQQEAAAGDEQQGEKEASEKEAAPAPEETILKPQELMFSRVLRAAPGEKIPEPGQIRPLKPVVPTGRSGEDAVAQTPGMSPATASGPQEAPAMKADMYDFVFQIAAYKSKSKAEDMRMRLEAEGFRSKLEKSGRFYVVLLLTRGGEERVLEVKEILQRMRLGDPLERSRTPVFRPLGER